MRRLTCPPRLRRGLGRADDLRAVQLAIMHREGREHPYYWASFIVAGEWANLEAAVDRLREIAIDFQVFDQQGRISSRSGCQTIADQSDPRLILNADS